MFAKTIIDSDAFLELPITSQALYFHLAMRADDDGFVNKPRAIMNMIGAKDADINILINKKFVILFENHVIVIKHWLIHNYIQKDRYKETKYKNEKALLFKDENNSYSLTPQDVSILDTECIQDVSTLDTQVRVRDRDSIELGKDRIETRDAFGQFWEAYPRKVGKQEAFDAFQKVSVPIETILAAIENQKGSDAWLKDDGRYIPNPANWLKQGRWDDEVRKKKTSADFSEDSHFKNAVVDLMKGWQG